MKRLMIAVLLLSAVPALADHDHGRRDDDDDRDAREVPEHSVAVSEEDVRQHLEDLAKMIDRMAQENRGRRRDRIADDARDELEELRHMLNEAPRIDRSRWRERYLERREASSAPVVNTPPPSTIPANYNPGSTHTVPPPPPGQGTYQQQQPVVYPITQPALNQLTGTMNRESFPRERLRVLQTAAPSNWFLVAQAQQILTSFNFPNDRLQAVRILKPRLLDRENFFKLYSSFEFSNDKAELKRILEQ